MGYVPRAPEYVEGEKPLLPRVVAREGSRVNIERFALLPGLTHYQVFGLDALPTIDVMGIAPVEVEPRATTLHMVMWSYLHEHCIQNTTNARRATQAAGEWCQALGYNFDASKITRGDGRKVIEALQDRGLKPGSVKRIMGVGIAALHHAKREGRITEIPKFPKISGGQPRVRWLSRDEHRRLMQAPMARRLKDFLIIAFATGARSEAIEQLTPRRVDFVARTIDFRLEGVDHKNKRRAVVPISDALLPRLQRMCAGRALD